MSTVKTVDNLRATPKGKPIQLIYCLQSSWSIEGTPRFCEIRTTPMDQYSQITRVGKMQIGNEPYDILVADRLKGDQTFWLGCWNDGFVE